jgi:hypothetical protein
MPAQITPAPLQPIKTLHDGNAINNAIAAGYVSSQYQLVATGTNQATGLQLTAQLNHFATVAASTGCLLPPANAGSIVRIFNYGANTLAIYGHASGDTIDGVASATGVTLSAANRVAYFFCVSPGVWVSSLGGAVSS